MNARVLAHRSRCLARNRHWRLPGTLSRQAPRRPSSFVTNMSAEPFKLPSAVGRQRKIAGIGVARHVGLSCRVHRDALSDVIAAASEQRRVGQRRTVGADLRDERVKVAVVSPVERSGRRWKVGGVRAPSHKPLLPNRRQPVNVILGASQECRIGERCAARVQLRHEDVELAVSARVLRAGRRRKVAGGRCSRSNRRDLTHRRRDSVDVIARASQDGRTSVAPAPSSFVTKASAEPLRSCGRRRRSPENR